MDPAQGAESEDTLPNILENKYKSIIIQLKDSLVRGKMEESEYGVRFVYA